MPWLEAALAAFNLRIVTYTTRVALANSVPAAAVIQEMQVLSGIIGRKGS